MWNALSKRFTFKEVILELLKSGVLFTSRKIRDIKSDPLTYFWGSFLLISLFFYTEDMRVKVTDAKDLLFVMMALLGVFTLKRIRLKAPVLIMVLSFFNIYSLGSGFAVFQWVMIASGCVLYSHARDFNRKRIFLFMSSVCIIMSLSILLGFFKIDFYEIVSNVYYRDYATGKLINGKEDPNDYFLGLLNARGHSGLLIAITSMFGGPIVVVLAFVAMFKLALLGTVTPFIAAFIALVFKLAWVSKKALIVFISFILIVVIANSEKVKDRFNQEAHQLKTSERISIWKGTYLSYLDGLKKPLLKTEKKDRNIPLFLRRLFFGYGVGMFKDAEKYYAQKTGKRNFWGSTHNEFIEMLYTFGFSGFLFMVFIFIRGLLKTWGDPFLFPSVLCLMICSVIWFPFHIAIVAPVGIIILSMSNSNINQGEDKCEQR